MRLNTIQKAEILAKLNDGVKGNRLAKEYDVAKSTISLLKKRKYNEMQQPDERSGTFNTLSSVNEGENKSIHSKNVSTSSEDETSDESNDDERFEKKSRTLPMFRQLKLSKQPFDIDEEQHIDDDAASECDDDDEEEEDESEEEEEDLNEICRKLHNVCSNLHVPAQSLRVMFRLFSKLRSSGCIE